MSKFNKGISEVAFRMRQFLWNAKDRLRSYRESEFDGLENIQASCSYRRFFLNPGTLKSITLQYDSTHFEWKDSIIEKANKVCKHKFDLLGYKNLSFDKEDYINWHLDPVNNKRSPTIWWQYIRYMDANIVGDSKVIWELNRHQHLVLLGKAYVLSDDSKYLHEFINQLNSWFATNPPKQGINWTSSLELAYRSISWIWAYHLFEGAKSFTDDFLGKFFGFMNLQAEHIEHNLSTYFSPNTHLTGEALGLFYVGALFPGLKSADRWLEKGKDILIQEIDRHVLSDGGYMERSFWYHRYTLDIYIHFYILSKLNNISLPHKVEKKIVQLGEFLMYASCPDRSFPLIGDDDGGRLLPLDSLEGKDLRGLFSTISVLFKRGDFKYLSGGYQEETLWLLGPDSKKVYGRVEVCEPSSISKGFKETGYYFMRNDWSKNANYLAFVCGPHGWLNCGHAHADLLSFQINSGDHPIIVDPGTYKYISDYRDYFRSSDSHSTIKIDGFYPAVTGGPFQWMLIPEHEFIKWDTVSKYDYVSGCMVGSTDWKHVREVFFVKPDIFFITDTIKGKGRHELEIRFPLYGKEWDIRRKKCLLKNTNKACSIEYVGQSNLGIHLTDSVLSLCYGHKMPSYTLLFKGTVELSCKIGFLINLSKQAYEAELSLEAEDTYFKIVSKKTQSNIFVHGCKDRES